LDGFRQQLVKNPFKNIDHEYAALIHMQRELDIIDPKNVLKRGYSLTLVNGKNINKVKDLKKDTKITTITKYLELESSIVSTKKINHDN
jgi:exodeoxyribonuclease VII large subunit